MIQRSGSRVSFKILLTLCILAAPRANAVVNEYAEAITASSPDNSFETLKTAIDQARNSIRLTGYTFGSAFITDHLIDAAKRGVKVTLILDGWTVARPKKQKIPLEELLNAHLLEKAGAKVFYIASNDGLRRDRRFRYVHSKYAIIDEETVVISSENFGSHGFSTTTSEGSRGWVVAIKNANLAKEYLPIFESDLSVKKGFNDLVRYGSSPDYTLANPGAVKQDREERKGKYQAVPARTVREQMRLERVMSPDDSSETDRAILGALKMAKQSVYIQSLSFQPHWGPEGGSPEKSPSPFAEAVLSAARRGASVRIMLQPPIFSDLSIPDERSEYGLESFIRLPLQFFTGDENESKPNKSTKDNKALIAYFRKVARKESLDLQANMFWVENDSIDLLHNKGMVVDGDKTLVSSINWTENSVKQNREAAVLITNKSVADYYQDLFLRDWNNSRNRD